MPNCAAHDSHRCRQVYVVGDVGIEEELDLLGIQHCGGPSDADKVIELKPGYALPHDKDVRRPPNPALRMAAALGT